jgi:hypothetical protein
MYALSLIPVFVRCHDNWINKQLLWDVDMGLQISQSSSLFAPLASI